MISLYLDENVEDAITDSLPREEIDVLALVEDWTLDKEQRCI